VTFPSGAGFNVRGIGKKIMSGGLVEGTLFMNPDLEKDINTSPEMLRELTTLTDKAAQYAFNLAPWRSGTMRNSIQPEVGLFNNSYVGLVKVGSGASYWVFVEYGTGQRGAGSDQPEPGTPQGYAHGGRAGQAAQPFMRRTLWWLKEQIGG